MDKNEILELFKERIQIKEMSYVGEGEPEEKKYCIEFYLGTLVVDDNGNIIVKVPNVSGQVRCRKFLYAGPYMLIGNDIYYYGKKTKYHSNRIYLKNHVLQCEEESGKKFFIANGKAIKSRFNR